MKHAGLIFGLLAGIIFVSRSSEAQFTADFQTNIISGVTSNWSGDYLIGSNTFADVLKVNFGGWLTVDNGYVGYEANASNNIASIKSSPVAGGPSWWNIRTNLFVGYSGAGNQLIIDDSAGVTVGSGLVGASYIGYNTSSSKNNVSVYSGSDWSNSENIYVGYGGAGNSLTISNGGQVVNGSAFVGRSFIGYNGSSSNNVVLVTGTGSVWTSHVSLSVGWNGPSNSLVIIDGGEVVSGPTSQSSGAVGSQASSSNNSVLITGSGSVWNDYNWAMFFGLFGMGNSIVISNGGKIANNSGYVGNFGSGKNNVRVIGAGSVWSNRSDLFFGYYGEGNSLTIDAGAQVTVISNAYVGFLSNSSNNSVRVASGAVWQNKTLHVGEQGPSNSLVVAGGSVFATNLIVGVASSLCNNLVQLDSGSVIVTNATTDAVLEVRKGKLILNGGVLRVDQFVMTNACAQFVHTGGTLIYGVAVLDPNRDDDGDGIANGWEQAYGLDPLNGVDANVDSDGDGFTNAQEFQAGTDPTDSASSFRITSLLETDHDVLVTWTMGSGKTNALQATEGDGGYYTNDFTDIFTVTNTVGSVTNYLDAGAAGATSTSRFYRVRLVP